MSKKRKNEGEKQRREGPLSMHPLDPEDALKGILQVPKEAVDEAERKQKEWDSEESEDGEPTDD